MRKEIKKGEYRTYFEVTKEWNDEDKKPEGFMLEILLDIRSLLGEMIENQTVITEEKKQEQDTCSQCGLKRKFWGQMFCADGWKDHKE